MTIRRFVGNAHGRATVGRLVLATAVLVGGFSALYVLRADLGLAEDSPPALTSGASDSCYAYCAPPIIHVANPNGGETFASGTPMKIRWTYSNADGRLVKIGLYRDGVYVRQIVSNRPIGSGGAGQLWWTIPVDTPADNSYRVRVVIQETSPVAADKSNANFSIT
jgi:hypothetical protein